MTKQIDIPHQDGDPEFDDEYFPQTHLEIADDGFVWLRFTNNTDDGMAMSPKEFEFAIKWYMENK